MTATSHSPPPLPSLDPLSRRIRVRAMAGMPEATGAGDGTPAAGKHRVVIVGGGFGGLFAARVLKRAPVDVTLVDRVNHHLFQPLLYQVATGILSEGQIAPALRSMFRHQPNVRVLLAEVTDIDLAAGIVRAHVPDGDDLALGYD